MTEKDVKKDEVKDVKKVKKEKKESVMKVVDRIKFHAMEGKCKTREELAKKVKNDFNKAGITHNIRGYEITESTILRLMSAFFKCITNYDGEGNPRKGWWSNFTLVEGDTIIMKEKK